RIIPAHQLLGAAPGVGVVHHVAYLLDTGLAAVDLHLRPIAQYQYTLVAQAHVALEANQVFVLVETGLAGLGLEAALLQQYVALQRAGLAALLETAGIGAGIDGELVEGGVVIPTGARRFDVVAAA